MSNIDPLVLKESGDCFCASLLKDGKSIEMIDQPIENFVRLIFSSKLSWLDYTLSNVKSEAPKLASQLGFSGELLTQLLKKKNAGYEDFDHEMALLLPAIIVSGFNVHVTYLLIMIKKGLIVTVHTPEIKRFFRMRRYAKIFMKKMNKYASPIDRITLLLFRIIDENNSRNFEHLREIEENSDHVSEKMTNVNTPRQEISLDIHTMKHSLIAYLNGLWETMDVLNTLRYGDPELLSDNPKLVAQMNGLVSEVNNQISLAEHMSEVLASGLEVMQSIYNNQLQILNNKIALLVAYLTVLGTAVLVPNTLATILTSDVFGLSSKDQFLYLSIIVGSTLISIIASYWWVKKSGLLVDSKDN